MIGFPLTRKRLGRGGMNPLAYLGMTGDIAVIAGLYFYFKQRKINKEKKKLANRENDLRVMAESFPPKVESIDYNRFSPYTPILIMKIKTPGNMTTISQIFQDGLKTETMAINMDIPIHIITNLLTLNTKSI